MPHSPSAIPSVIVPQSAIRRLVRVVRRLTSKETLNEHRDKHTLDNDANH